MAPWRVQQNWNDLLRIGIDLLAGSVLLVLQVQIDLEELEWPPWQVQQN